MTRTWCLALIVLALSVSVFTAASAKTFLVYDESGITGAWAEPGNSVELWTWCDTGQPCDVSEPVTCTPDPACPDSPYCGGLPQTFVNPEGGRFLNVRANAWAGMGVFINVAPGNDGIPDTVDDQPLPGADLSAYADGEIRFFVKAPDTLTQITSPIDDDVKIEFQCKPASSTLTKTLFLTKDTNWDGTNDWQEIVIPVADFFAPQPVDMDCLANIVAPLMITLADIPSFNTFALDYVRWHTADAPHAGASLVQIDERQLTVNGEPFVVNGAAYAPISIGEDWRGSLRDRSDRYLVDFPLMAASGVNVVRIYTSFLTTAMLDAAWSEGLYVIPTYTVQVGLPNGSVVVPQLWCDAGKDFMQDRLLDFVDEWKDHPAILFWMIGNEVNNALSTTELCDDWYPQLDALAAAVEAIDPNHPVVTANADSPGLSDICMPGCSDDTSLPNLDLWAVHLYRGCSFGTAFNEYRDAADCAKPLIVGEFGADAWDSLMGSENEGMQAQCLTSLLDQADQALAARNPDGVSTGQVLFEWTDEWWKAFPTEGGDCTDTDWAQHDTCANSTNGAYPDPAVNEEWWGITSLDSMDADERGLRSAHDAVAEWWQLGAVRDLEVVGHDAGSGNTDISFLPAAGSTDHTLYWGYLSDVSSYSYQDPPVTGLGATGSSSVTLPAGSLFWVVVGRNNGAEGCYAKDSGCSERPCFPESGSCSLAQAAYRTCSVPQCP